MTHAALKDRDPNKPNTEQGLFRKFDVFRTDLSDQPGGKHHGCEYFVLDLTHDPHAKAALAAYAVAVNKTHPQLAADLCQRYDLSAMEGEAVAAGYKFYCVPGEEIQGPDIGGVVNDALESGYVEEGADLEIEEWTATARFTIKADPDANYTAPPPQQAASDEDAAEKYRVAWQAGRDAQKAEQAATQPQQAGGDAINWPLVREGLDYFDRAGDAGDKLYVAEIRKALDRPTPPQPEAGGGEALSEDDVSWIVNDNAELGVMIRGRAFFLYKGGSLVYEDAKHDDGTPMLYRMVGKREFGEVCHPIKFYRDGFRIPDRYTETLVYTSGLSFGAKEDGDWRPLPPTTPASGGEHG